MVSEGGEKKEESYTSHSVINPKSVADQRYGEEEEAFRFKGHTTTTHLAFEFSLTQSCTLVALLSPRLLSRT